MTGLNKRWLYAAACILTTCALKSAIAAEPPSDLCSLLPAAEVSKTLGQTYGAPQKSVAPRPYPNTAEGADCNYVARNSKLWFRAYVDPSPAAAADLFAKLSRFYGTPIKVSGVGDEAYFDAQHALHVRKGRVRYYLNLDPMNFTPTVEKQMKDLGILVAGRV